MPPNCFWLYGALSRSIAIARRREALEVLLRVERVVAEEEERVARGAVGPALRHDVDDAARRLAELRGVRVGEHLELPHRFLAERGAHAADDDVVVVEAVDGDVVRARPLTGEGQPGRRRRALLRRVVVGDAGRNHRERDEVAAVDRQVVDLLLRDDAGDRRLAATISGGGATTT